MAFLSAFAVTFGRIATLLQVIVYLPLTLDVAGQDAFLALSASLAVYYAFLSTARILTRRTSLAWLGDFLAVFQFIVVPACLLIVFHAYSPPSESYFDRKYITKDVASSLSAPSSLVSLASQAALYGGSNDDSSADGMRSLFSSKARNAYPATTNYAAAHSAATAELNIGEAYLGPTLNKLLLRCVAVTFFLARRVPPWWHTLLRLSSPVFSLLEGIATLLVIQVVGSFSRWMIASSLSRRPPAPTRSYLIGWLQTVASALTSAEFLQIFFLLASALIYVISALALYMSFEGATRDRPGSAAATGAAITSVLWLTAIAFAVRKGNVVETALVFAYVTWNVYQLADSLSFTADPLSLIRSFKVLDTAKGTPLLHVPVLLDNLPPVVFILVEHMSNALVQSARFGAAAAAALPKSVIVSLVYRLMVLYSASRILPLLKRQTSKPWDSSSWSGSTESGDDRDTDSSSSDSSSSDDDDEDSSQDVHRGENTTNSSEKLRGKQPERRHKPSRRRRQRHGQSRTQEKEPVLREEESFGAFISLIVSYARLILIAVYSHLLLLDQSHMVYWRFLTVGITLFIWALELVLGKDDNPDAAFAGSWHAS